MSKQIGRLFMLNFTSLTTQRRRLIYAAVILAGSHNAESYAAQCDFTISNEWNSGFTSALTITNDGSTEINGWTVGFEYPDGSQINNVWNADISGANPYQLSNKNYNAKIQPGQSTSFGFNSRKANSNQSAPIPVLSGICDNDPDTPAPEVSLTTSTQSGEIPLTVEFDASGSSSQTGDIASYVWEFGDGTSASGAVVNHTFDQVGEYEVSLQITDTDGNSQTFTVNISATMPQPDDALCEFTVRNEWHSGFTGQVRITNEALYPVEGWTVLMTFPDATRISGSWNSQLSGNNPYTLTNANYNGNISPGQSVQFGFNAQKAQPGSPVSTPVLGGLCRGGDVSPPNQPPQASASASVISGTAPLTVNFSSEGSADPDGDDISYLWSFGTGSQSTEANPQFMFNAAGNYTVSLVVSDGELETEAQSINITVEQPVVAEPQSWLLDTQKSSLWFVSTKKLHTLENHTFTSLAGAITAEGDASLAITMDSIESAIDIRNERMREHLFETSMYPEAEVMMSVDVAELAQMPAGASEVSDISALLNLHGVSVPVQAQVRISKLPDGALLVNNLQPILLAAADFNLDTGIETLKQLAGLSSISYTVPVNFHLLFTPETGTPTTDDINLGEE